MDQSHDEHDGRPHFDPIAYYTRACMACGTKNSIVGEYEEAGGLPLCGSCSERVANIWWHKHSGQYLTWTNAPIAATRRFRKEVIPEQLRWQVFERDGFKCLHCGGRRMLRADHIHPESAGGRATLENLQTLCNRCNSRKGSRVEDR